MTRKLAFVALLVGATTLVTANRAAAVHPVLMFIVEYLGSALIDEIYSEATGKPDIRKLDERLKALEENAALRSEMREEIRRVRGELNERVTKDEMRKILEGLQNQLGSIKRRLDNLEERSELQEVQIADGKNGTKNAESAYYFLTRGRERAQLKEYERALANFAVAISVDPKLSDAYIARAQTFVEMKAAEVAILDYTKAIEIAPKSIDALRGRAILFNRQKAYAKAITDATAILAESSTDAEAFNQRAFAYLQTSSYDQSIEDYKACLKQVPSFGAGWNNLGIVHQRKKEHHQAVSCLTKAVEQDGKSARYRASLAFSKYQLVRYSEAIEDADKAIALDAKIALGYEVRGLSRYLVLGERDKALPDLTQAIQLGTDNSQVFEFRGEIHSTKADYPGALTDFNRAIALGANGWAVHHNRGEMNRSLKNYADAVRDLSNAVKLAPEGKDKARSYYYRAYANLGNNDRASYRSDIDNAIRLDADYQKSLTYGDVVVVNNTNTKIIIDVDYWVYPDGSKEEFSLPYQYTIEAGQRTFLLHDNKQVVAKKFEGAIKTDNGKKRYYWDYKSGSTLEVAVNQADLP